jgi:hypothetical protein
MTRRHVMKLVLKKNAVCKHDDSDDYDAKMAKIKMTSRGYLHARFKQECNERFARYAVSKKTMVLDAKEGATSRTCIQAGINPQDIVAVSHTLSNFDTWTNDVILKHVHQMSGTLQEALQVSTLPSALYNDGCHSSASLALQDMQSFIDAPPDECQLAVTIIGRGKHGCAAKHLHVLMNTLHSKGFEPCGGWENFAQSVLIFDRTMTMFVHKGDNEGPCDPSEFSLANTKPPVPTKSPYLPDAKLKDKIFEILRITGGRTPTMSIKNPGVASWESTRVEIRRLPEKRRLRFEKWLRSDGGWCGNRYDTWRARSRALVCQTKCDRRVIEDLHTEVVNDLLREVWLKVTSHKKHYGIYNIKDAWRPSRATILTMWTSNPQVVLLDLGEINDADTLTDAKSVLDSYMQKCTKHKCYFLINFRYRCGGRFALHILNEITMIASSFSFTKTKRQYAMGLNDVYSTAIVEVFDNRSL